MKKIGELLRQERESQGLSLEQAADRTKIHHHKLDAIEKGDSKSLPAAVFAKGLIRSYANFLKIDSAKINKLIEEEFGESKKDWSPPSPEKMQASNEDIDTQVVGHFQMSKTLYIIAAIGTVIILSFFIVLAIEKINSYKEEEVIDPMLEMEVEQTKEETTETIETAAAETKAEPEPVSKTVATPKKQSPKPQVKDEEPSADEPPEEVNTHVIRSNNKLTLEAIEPVRVEIIWSDGKPQVMLLKARESKTLVFSSAIKLRVNNGGAVNINFNGKNRGIPGKLNQPIELNYP